MTTILQGAEPFYLRGGRTGCLLIHGFTGTPREMRFLGQHLANEGHTVLGVRLFAHATRPEDMLRARWTDWYASAEDGYHLLREHTDAVVAMGLSMGGILALLMGARLPLAGVVAMSTPFFPPDPRMRLRPLFSLISPFWQFAKKSPPDWHDLHAAVGHLEYPLAPVRGGAELYDLLAELRRSLPSVSCPVLVIHSRGDLTVGSADAEAIFANLGSIHKELLWVEDSGHVVTCDAERERVFAAVADFVRRLGATTA